jgi:hypothetical protein
VAGRGEAGREGRREDWKEIEERKREQRAGERVTVSGGMKPVGWRRFEAVDWERLGWSKGEGSRLGARGRAWESSKTKGRAGKAYTMYPRELGIWAQEPVGRKG